MDTMIEYPGVPFLFELPGGMFAGRRVRLDGTVNSHAKNFFVDFQCGPNVDPSDTVAFQLAFLFNKSCVERNHYVAEEKAWGFREHAGALPLQPGQGFTLEVRCEEPSFLVEINGMPFCEFGHRLTFDSITHLYVQGDVEIEAVEVLP